MQERPNRQEGALPLAEEDTKEGIGDPAYSQVSRVKSQRIMQVETKKSLTKSGCRDIYLRKRVHGVEEICSQISN
jgi:hypothetical protein